MRIGVLGGSFNPVHCGHLRLAIEVKEALSLDVIELIPSARPPHKPDEPMFDFAVRAALLREACAGLEGFRVNELEAGREGPSYTYDTLEIFCRERPGDVVYFILGVTDLLNLPYWKRGLELGGLANLCAVSRQGLGLERVEEFVSRHEAGLSAKACGPGRWTLAGGRDLVFLEAPGLAISSSLVRERWRAGRSLKFLVPPCVEAWFAANPQVAAKVCGNGPEKAC